MLLNINWDFKVPVRPDDTVTGRIEVTAVRDNTRSPNLSASVARDDVSVVLSGTAVCLIMSIDGEASVHG